MQTGTHSFPHPVAETVLARGTLRPELINRLVWADGSSGRAILEVGSDNHRVFVVISSVNNQADCVPNPFTSCLSSQLVDYKHLRIEDGTQNSEFGCLHRRA